MTRFRQALPWILGALAATLLFAALVAYTPFEYAGTDDAPILRSFMGYEGGEPAHYSLLVHTVLAWILWGLAKGFPGVAWFSIFQLAFLWLATAVVVKSFARGAQRRGLPVWLGALFGVGLTLAGALWISCRVSFTTTAAWLGAAAVAQLVSIDWAGDTDKAVRRGLLLSVLLLVLCYFHRQVSVVPPLLFWLLGLGVAGLSYFGKRRGKRGVRPLAVGLAVCLGSLLLLSGVRLIETRVLGLEPFQRWEDASGELLDYADLDNLSPTDETLAQIGWSREEYTLFTYWYFMDDNINPDTLHTLYTTTFQTPAKPLGERLVAALHTVGFALQENPPQAWAFYLGLGAAALCLLLALLLRPAAPWGWLGALGAPLLALALLGYLGWEGRLPMRALVSVTLPMAALTLALLLAALPAARGAGAKGIVCLALCAGLLVPMWQATALSWQAAVPAPAGPDDPETPVEADLDEYALENPDTLFIYDLSLVCDRRLFPDTSAGIPGNVLFWGGHPARSPSWYAMLARYGITELNASLFLQDNVLVASTDPEPWPSLTAYIGQQTGQAVDWEYADSYGYINFFRIYAY